MKKKEDSKSGKELSPLTKSIRFLIDGSATYTRQEWSELLNVTTSAISQWVNDKTLPRPDTLQLVLTVLREQKRTEPSVAVKEFENLLHLPLEEIADTKKKKFKAFERTFGTLNGYMLSGLLEEHKRHFQEGGVNSNSLLPEVILNEKNEKFTKFGSDLKSVFSSKKS